MVNMVVEESKSMSCKGECKPDDLKEVCIHMNCNCDS